MPRISVAMSVYNGENYIKECIESILTQTYLDFEFIICDDASTDRSLEMLKEYERRDSRIVVTCNEVNEGLSASLNKCISIAVGEYIVRMDVDDISLPDRFEKQIEFLDNNPDIAFVCGGVYLLGENGVWGQRNNSTPLTKENIYKYQPIAHPTTMIRNSVLKIVNGYTVGPYTKRGQDFDLWCKIYAAGYKGKNIGSIVLYYREDQNSYKKRLFKHRIDLYKMKKYWRKRLNLPYYYEVHAFKPVLIGLIPKTLLSIYHMRKFKLEVVDQEQNSEV